MAKAVQGLNDLGYKLKGRDGKDVQRVEKLFRSGNKKVLQGAIRALDTDIRDQIMDILEPLGFVKDGVVEAKQAIVWEENVKKGDSVKIINAKKYDALSKPEVSGIVIGMLGSKVMVKVGSGQMNVDPKDLVKESVTEAKQAIVWKVKPPKGQKNIHPDSKWPGMKPGDIEKMNADPKDLVKESVELDEALKKGDSVIVRNARKYDALAKPPVSGTVIGMIGSKVMVKVGSGQMNVDAKDLDKVVANESVELDEGALGKQWQNGAKMVKSGSITLVKAKNPDADLHTVMKNGKKVGTFVFDDGPDAFSVTNMSTKKVSWADQIDDIPKMFESKAPALKSSDYPKGTSQSAQAFKDKFAKNKKESVELDESRDEALKALEDLVKKGGIDKADFQKAHTLYKVNKLNDLRKHISSLDTDPAEAIVRAFSRRDPNAFKSMYPRAKAGDYFANIIGNHKESVELGEAFTPKDIKMAIGIASDKRYAGGNMTGAVNAIEKIKKGLSNHSQVKAVLKRQNESLDASTINEAGSSERLALIKKAVLKVRARNAALEKKAAAAAKRDMKAKGAQRGMAPLKKDDLDEAKGSKYDVYHKDFSTAVQYARKEVEKQGYKIDDEEWFRKVGSGPRKPSVGKTNQYNIDLMKNDKDVKQKLHMQVYGMDNGKYELNMYVS